MKPEDAATAIGANLLEGLSLLRGCLDNRSVSGLIIGDTHVAAILHHFDALQEVIEFFELHPGDDFTAEQVLDELRRLSPL